MLQFPVLFLWVSVGKCGLSLHLCLLTFFFCLFFLLVCFVLFLFVFILLLYFFTFLDACLYSNETVKKSVDLGGWGCKEVGKDLGEAGVGETVIRIYCVKIYFQLEKRNSLQE